MERLTAEKPTPSCPGHSFYRVVGILELWSWAYHRCFVVILLPSGALTNQDSGIARGSPQPSQANGLAPKIFGQSPRNQPLTLPIYTPEDTSSGV